MLAGYGIVNVHGNRPQVAMDVLRDGLLAISVRLKPVNQKLEDIPLLRCVFMLDNRFFYIFATSVDAMIFLEAVNGRFPRCSIGRDTLCILEEPRPMTEATQNHPRHWRHPMRRWPCSSQMSAEV